MSKTLGICAMQNYPSVLDKKEFVYMFKYLFEELDDTPYKGWNEFAKLPITKCIGKIAKWFFNYSPAYPNADVTWNYYKFYGKHHDLLK